MRGGAAQGLFDAGLQHRAVQQRQADRAAKVVAVCKLAVVVGCYLDARQQGLHARVGVRLPLKVRQTDMAVQQGARQYILKAELGVQRAAGLRPVGVLQAALMNPGFNALNHVCGQGVLSHQRQHGVNRRVRAAAAGVLLDGDARRHDVQRRRPGGQCTRDVVSARAVENVQKSLFMLEHAGRVGCEALRRQSCRQQAAASAVAHMQGLGHGAEVRFDACCK